MNDVRDLPRDARDRSRRSFPQRKPGASLSSTAKTEVDYLLTRLARTDKRAELKPRLAQAS